MSLAKFVITLWLIVQIQCAKLPDYIKACDISSPNRMQCAKDAAQNALYFIINGDKNYNIPSLLPYKFPRIELNVGDNLHLVFRDCELLGFETIDFKHVDFDAAKRRVSFEGTLNKINMLADYDISGQILIIPVSGSGPANVTLVGIKFSHELTYDLYKKKDVDYLKVTGSKLQFSSDRTYYKLDNLFGGDSILSTQVNRFLDENWTEIDKEINPALTEIVNRLITKIVKNIISKVPYKEITLAQN